MSKILANQRGPILPFCFARDHRFWYLLVVNTFFMGKINTFIEDHPVLVVITIYWLVYAYWTYRDDMTFAYLLLLLYFIVGSIHILVTYENEREWNNKSTKTWVLLFIIVSWFLWAYKVSDLIKPSFTLTEPLSCNIDPEVMSEFECKWDCSGHEAWYEWACEKFNDATFYQCWWNSESFRQWCEWFQKIYLKR